MARLSPNAIAQLVKSEGFADPVTATAVVLGESGGDTDAVNTNSDGTRDRGLWQLNSKDHPSMSDADAFDMLKSTRYAKSISAGGRDFRLWHATTAPAFADHLVTARKAVAESPDTIGSGGLGNVIGSTVGNAADTVAGAADKLLPGNPFGSIVDALGTLTALGIKVFGVLLDPDFWKRLGLGLAGVVLIAVGVAMLRPDLTAKVGGLAAGGPAGASIAAAFAGGA